MHSYQSECNQLCMKYTMLLDSMVIYIVLSYHCICLHHFQQVISTLKVVQ